MRVRPYLMTNGRVRPSSAQVGFETILLTTDFGRHSLDKLVFEHLALATLCNEPQSVAEASVRLRIPIGVAQVVASELAASGHLSLSTSESAADDISLLTRLINGVRAL